MNTTPSTNPPDILGFYTAVIKSLGLSADSAGLLSMTPTSDVSVPVGIGKLRMALPTKQMLHSSDWENYIPFHPLCESVIRAESDVIKKTKLLATMRLNMLLIQTIESMYGIAADVSKHISLTPTQVEAISVLGTVDNKTLTDIGKILSAITDDKKEGTILSIYLKRNAKLLDESYTRAAIVTFPIMDELKDGSNSVFGVTMRKTDKATLRSFLNWLLPDVEKEGSYSVGSNSPVAPYFHSLMKAFLGVYEPINNLTWTFKKHFSNVTHTRSDVKWKAQLETLHEYQGLIPSLPGNTGAPAKGKVEEVMESEPRGIKPKPVVFDAPVTPVQPSHTAQPQPTVHIPDDGSAWNREVAAYEESQRVLQYGNQPSRYPIVGQSFAASVTPMPHVQQYIAPAPTGYNQYPITTGQPQRVMY